MTGIYCDQLQYDDLRRPLERSIQSALQSADHARRRTCQTATSWEETDPSNAVPVQLNDRIPESCVHRDRHERVEQKIVGMVADESRFVKRDT
jgi:hypothetical protein